MTTPLCLIGSPELTCNEFFLITFQLFFLLRVSASYNLSKIITALFLNVTVQSNGRGVEWLWCLEIMSDSPRKAWKRAVLSKPVNSHLSNKHMNSPGLCPREILRLLSWWRFDETEKKPFLSRCLEEQKTFFLLYNIISRRNEVAPTGQPPCCKSSPSKILSDLQKHLEKSFTTEEKSLKAAKWFSHYHSGC